jgi:transposase
MDAAPFGVQVIRMKADSCADGIDVPKWKYRATTQGEESDMHVTTIGVDLAKQVFAVHGVDQSGKVVIRKMLRREQMVAFFTRLASCTVAMEACGSAHYWARRLAELGHTTKLIAPQFVKPYVKSNKHDAADAEAICEAASRPGIVLWR